MKVSVKDIGPDGYDIDGELTAESIGLTKEDYLHFISPVAVHAHLDRYENTILVKIVVSGRFRAIDYRNSEHLERDWSESFELDFEINHSTEFIEIDEDIRQEVIMRIPMRVSTKEEEEEQKAKKKQADLMEQAAQEKPQTYQPFKNLKLKREKG